MPNSKIKQKTVVTQVMRKIKALIASGAYKPGEKIPTELELAGSFGVGRSSIREAVKIFNYLGVLESRPALGTFVKERSNISREALTWSLLLGNDDLEEMVDLRGTIELWAMLSLAGGIKSGNPDKSAAITNLESVVEKMRLYAEQGDRDNLIEADFMFHNIIVKSYNNSLFSSLFDTLKSFLYEEIKTSQLDYKNLFEIHNEHLLLLDAIKSENRNQILSSYTAHIENIKSRMKHQEMKVN